MQVAQKIKTDHVLNELSESEFIDDGKKFCLIMRPSEFLFQGLTGFILYIKRKGSSRGFF